MMKRFIFIFLALLLSVISLRAQSTIGITQGFGSGFVRAYPSIESKSIYGLSTTSLQWRHYSETLFLGCVGVDLELMERGFAYAPYTSTNNTDDDRKASDLLYYYRYVNSVMLPLVWQPHVYLFHNRVRVFADAAVTFSYNYSSSYKNDLYHSYSYNADKDDWKGEYDMRDERDNSFGYGLAFGGGISYLHGRYEFQLGMRYYFGYSDILKNRTQYYSNTTDNVAENPFSYTPLRSPLDNINIKFGVSYRLGNKGFASWNTVRLRSSGLRDGFEYDGE